MDASATAKKDFVEKNLSLQKASDQIYENREGPNYHEIEIIPQAQLRKIRPIIDKEDRTLPKEQNCTLSLRIDNDQATDKD